MATDLTQFHEAFFEESLEAVDDMESGLLNMDVEHIDPESINTIFRAAHSIKGCSATFGFTDIANFVHVMETVLDEMRDGNLKPTQETVDVLLKSLDALRMMIQMTRVGTKLDSGSFSDIQNRLQSVLSTNKAHSGEALPKSAAPVSKGREGAAWEIHFEPQMDIMKTGNDPLRMFGVLQDLGEVKTTANMSGLLDFRTIDPEDCYLSWDLTLTGAAAQAEIEEVFEWVADECKLRITMATASENEEHEHSFEHSAVRKSDDPHPHEKSANGPSHSDSASIRVGIDKVDAIINMVGELVITQSMLDQLGGEFEEELKNSAKYEKLRSGLIQLERNTRELQESVMRIRMLPISYVFNRVPRIVHDLSKKLNKDVNVKMSGENTELDKTVLEKIGDPLVHLIRNALDHGIESPQQRRASGKPATGTIYLNAYHKGGNIVVEVRDDGAGLNKNKIITKAKARGLVGNDETITDEKIYELIFKAGFSTADIVSDVSGRGVGMDVVKKNIKALGGNIEMHSVEGQGTSFTIRLPLTLAILDGQLVRVGSETYIVPLISIIESLQIKPEYVNKVAGQAEVYKLRNEYIPFIRMHDLFGVVTPTTDISGGLMVVVEGDGKRAGLVVDDLLAQQQVVIKSLETNYRRIDGLSGATILGDGTVALIVDVTGLINLSHKSHLPRSGNHGAEKITQVAAA
ncbi:MAG: chemotaxis protein CheA [Gammaproteobacteria bacterium]|nr:chemotaxis protein CheA [Gammaproteobacteria bacterium]